VRLDFTQVQGELDAIGTGDITLNVSAIDGQPVSLFSFTGTGSVTGVDTDPAEYVVSTGTLDVSQFSVGGSVLGIGFVNPFGTVPPDFTAVTIANGAISNNGNCDGNSGDGGNNNCSCNGNSGGSGSNNCMCNGNNGGSGSNNCMCNGNSGGSGSNNCMCNGNSGGSGSNNCMCNGNSGGSGGNNCTCNGNSGGSGSNNCINMQTAQLDIDWGSSGTATPFKTLVPAGLDLDRSNAGIGSHHEIETNQGNINIESLAADVSITGSSSGMDLFSIAGQHGRATANFGSFADFEAALVADLDGSTMALRLTAEGQYDAASSTFTAQRITISLSN
jgi:hypothetical protein